MTDDPISREEYQHILLIMNSYGDPDCQECASIRKKLEQVIAEHPDDKFFS